jgi:TetR/AcrR family transcriptional regulator, transcriptional repressor for nem operon
MSKGDETKERIIQQAAELFNRQGYAGSSISDIMQITGLQKGGIYNHFKSKDDLALQAFDYAIAQIIQAKLAALRGKRNAIERLQALNGVFRMHIDNPENPIVKGGCPLLNTAVESDDAHPALRERTQRAMSSWRNMICKIIKKGVERAEIRRDVNADEVATIIISTLEGGVMMSKLYGDKIHLERVINYLDDYVERHLKV